MMATKRSRTRFYTCGVCGGPIHQSHISGGFQVDPDGTDHLVHLNFWDWQDNVHQAVIAK
jgi:hypothetical protein